MDLKQQRNLLLVAVVVLLVALGAAVGTGGFELAGSAGQGKGKGGPPEGVPGNAKGIGKNEEGQFVVENEEELSNDPLNLGASVVGPDAFVQGLNIGSSGGNDVVYISENALPAAYGAPNRSVTGEPGITNGCSLPGGGFLDIGAGPDYSHLTRNHEYEFTFTEGPVTTFSIGVVDYADYLPFGTNSDGVYGMIMTAFNSNGDVVDTDEIMFSTGDSSIARITNEFGDLQTSGDACLAETGTQPGNYIFRVNGQGITRVTLTFKDQASQDPNIALWAGPLEFERAGACINFHALDTSSNKAFDYSGTADVEYCGGGVWSDGTGEASNNSVPTANPAYPAPVHVSAQGFARGQNLTNAGLPLFENTGTVVGDPIAQAGIAPPAEPAECNAELRDGGTYEISGVVCYEGIRMQPSADPITITGTSSDAVVYVKGDLDIQNQFTASNVMFYVEGEVRINSQAAVSLTPNLSGGQWHGFMIWTTLARNNDVLTINGGSGSNITGTLYAPNGGANINGSSNTNLSVHLIAQEIDFAGTNTTRVLCEQEKYFNGGFTSLYQVPTQ